jgi:poly(A) polymerase
MHEALGLIREATMGSRFEGDLYVVGGAVRDRELGLTVSNDLDLVTRGSAPDLAHLLYRTGLPSIEPVTYERFGTAMIRVGGANIELVTARTESYDPESRKPTVQAASYEEDAARRDFTINTLMINLHSGRLVDPLGVGLSDLKNGVLRTPLDPVATFRDDPLRMLRAIRFRWRFSFEPVPGLLNSIRENSSRLAIISEERIRDEWIKMLVLPKSAEAMQDLMDLGLFAQFAPEFLPMVGCEQGKYHHLDVWSHTLLVLKKAGSGDLILALGALLHDVGKPTTRSVDDRGNTRFFSHEVVGASMAGTILRRLRFPQKEIDKVVALVKNHMRLGSAPQFSPAAARRLIRDLDDQVDRLLDLVEADTLSLKPGVKVMELEAIRSQIESARIATPPAVLQSPLTGSEIMELMELGPGSEVGRLKLILTEKVLDGDLAPNDREGAISFLRSLRRDTGDGNLEA